MLGLVGGRHAGARLTAAFRLLRRETDGRSRFGPNAASAEDPGSNNVRLPRFIHKKGLLACIIRRLGPDWNRRNRDKGQFRSGPTVHPLFRDPRAAGTEQESDAPDTCKTRANASPAPSGAERRRAKRTTFVRRDGQTDDPKSDDAEISRAN